MDATGIRYIGYFHYYESVALYIYYILFFSENSSINVITHQDYSTFVLDSVDKVLMMSYQACTNRLSIPWSATTILKSYNIITGQG